MTETMDWDKALARVMRLLEESQKDAKSYPSAFRGLYDARLQNLRQRYERGERSIDLYNDMMIFAE